MRLREITTKAQLPDGNVRLVIDLVDLREYVGAFFEARLDNGFIANKIRNEVNELILDIHQEAMIARAQAQKKESQKATAPKEEEPETVRTKPKKKKAPPPKEEEDEDDEETDEFSEMEKLPNENEEAGEDEEIARLKQSEKELFDD